MVINSQRVIAATAADIDGRCRDNATCDRPDMVVFSGVNGRVIMKWLGRKRGATVIITGS
jgi:hypothetical protein